MTETIQTLDSLFQAEAQKAVRLCNGNLIQAAKLLGIGKSTLYRWSKKWEMPNA